MVPGAVVDHPIVQFESEIYSATGPLLMSGCSVDKAEFCGTLLACSLCAATKPTARTLTNRNAIDSFISSSSIMNLSPHTPGRCASGGELPDGQIGMRQSELGLESALPSDTKCRERQIYPQAPCGG